MNSMIADLQFFTAVVLMCLVTLGPCDAVHAQQYDSGTPVTAPGAVSPAEARAIAKEAYIYGFPMVDGYRIP